MQHQFAPSYVSLDLETAGLGYGIIEVGALRIENHRVTGEYQQLIRPRCAITYGAQRVHHITREMVADQPRFEAIIATLDRFIGDLPIIGYNILQYDLPILRTEYVRAGNSFHPEVAADVLLLTRSGLPELPNHRLDTVIRQLGIATSEKHRALSDAYDTARVYEWLRIREEKRARQ